MIEFTESNLRHVFDPTMLIAMSMASDEDSRREARTLCEPTEEVNLSGAIEYN